jgi:hypothetical protein
MEQPAAEQEKQAGGREYLSCISDVLPPPSLVEDRDRRYGEIDRRKTFRRVYRRETEVVGHIWQILWDQLSHRFRGIYLESGYLYPLSPSKPNDRQPLF